MRPDLAAQGLGDVDYGRENRERDREKTERIPPVVHDLHEVALSWRC